VALDAEQLHAISRRVSAHIRRTPLIGAPWGGYVKLESLQPTGSFKVRGFFAAALTLEPEQLGRGLMTVSAGNAALACAHVARQLGVGCRVVMFDTAPKLKADGVRALGAQVIPMPREALYDWMRTRAWEQEPETFIHPFADETVISGHATIAPEILDDCPQVERVLVPVGGGGLVCGVADGFAALASQVRIVGVQSDGYPLWTRALEAGGAVTLVPDTIAEGTAAPFDALMFERLQEWVDEWITVPEGDVRAAVRALATDVKVVAEGSGALAYAAMTGGGPADHTVAILSGGNIDAARLAELLASEAPIGTHA
jgi:threonine dehydratase